MKRRISMAMTFSFLLLAAVIASPQSIEAQPQQRQRCTVNTGVITLGLNQKLRVVVIGMGGNDAANVRFRRMEYTQDACDGGVCKLVVASQNTSAPITLMPGEAASMDITPMAGSSGVRAVILSNRRSVRATAMIINTVTGEPTSTSILETMEDDECGL